MRRGRAGFRVSADVRSGAMPAQIALSQGNEAQPHPPGTRLGSRMVSKASHSTQATGPGPGIRPGIKAVVSGLE